VASPEGRGARRRRQVAGRGGDGRARSAAALLASEMTGWFGKRVGIGDEGWGRQD
jgi:hypothetical protein